MARILITLAAIALLSSCVSQTGTGSRSFTILSINDVYRIEGLPSGQGGLARVRTLRAELEQTWPDLLLMHGGDLLYPSLPSRVFDGEHMVDVLNHLDGTHPGFDPRLFVVFGNHEFDKRRAKDYPLFAARMDESQFNWLGTNIDFAPFEQRDRLAPHVIDSTLITSGGVRVGIFGLTLAIQDVGYATFRASDDELRAISARMAAQLRAQGAEFVVALTHLPVSKDQMLLEQAEGPDMIIGGHEHNRIDRTVNGRRLLKADSDAVSARVTTVSLSRQGRVTVATQVRELVSPAVQPDAAVQARTQWWLDQHAATFCGKLAKPADCLDEQLAPVTREVLGEEILVRSEQTNLGSWVADLMLKSGKRLAPAPPGVPMVAFLNSGGLRLNQNLAPGTTFDRRHLEEMIKYSDPLMVLRLTADELREALNHSVSCRESGPWLQVAGLSFAADAKTGTAREIRVHGRPLAQVPQVYAVTSRFLASPDVPGDQDMYRFRTDQIVGTVKKPDGTAVELRALIEQELTGANGLSALSAQKHDRIRLVTAERAGGPGPLCTKQ